MLFFSLFSEKSQVYHDEWMASRCQLDPGFSANLSYVLIFLALKSHGLRTQRELDLLHEVNAKNRPNVVQNSYFNPIWRPGTRLVWMAAPNQIRDQTNQQK